MSEKILGNLSKGFLFILSGPAGTGKTTLVRMLRSEFPSIVQSISCTTRPPRPAEIPGKDYHFVTEEEFQNKIEAGDFLEHAQLFGHYYGTSKAYVQEQQEKGKHVVLVIDTQGAMQLKGKMTAALIFVSPPSLPELRERLFKRKTESFDLIEQRLSLAEHELEIKDQYDYQITNDNLNTAYEVLRSIIIAEVHKTALVNKEAKDFKN